MKNLFNFLSKKESKKETKSENQNVNMNTQTNEIKSSSEEVVVKAQVKAPKKEWDKNIKVKYFYKTDELTKYFLDSISQSLQILYKTEGYYISCSKKMYNEETGKFSSITSVLNIRCFSNRMEYIFRFMNMDDNRIKKMIDSFSKNSKKRLNKKITKLVSQLENPNRLVKLLNYLEYLGNNQFTYNIGNSKENAIAEKRKVYKDIVKHIKMNLEEELKKARAEYKEVKGDFYKKK